MEENRLKIIRDDLGGISQAKLAAKAGLSAYKLRDAESGKVKISHEIARIMEEKFGYSFRWVLTGQGEKFTESPQEGTPAALIYNKDMATPEHSHPGIDPALQAMSDIKDIFASGDPILIPAIQANINAFKRSLQRERQFSQLINENKELRDSIAGLQAQVDDLRRQVNRLTAPSITAEQQEAS